MEGTPGGGRQSRGAGFQTLAAPGASGSPSGSGKSGLLEDSAAARKDTAA